MKTEKQNTLLEKGNNPTACNSRTDNNCPEASQQAAKKKEGPRRALLIYSTDKYVKR